MTDNNLDRACAPDGVEPASPSQAKPLVPIAGKISRALGAGIVSVSICGLAANLIGLEFGILHQFVVGMVGIAIGLWLEVRVK